MSAEKNSKLSPRVTYCNQFLWKRSAIINSYAHAQLSRHKHLDGKDKAIGTWDMIQHCQFCIRTIVLKKEKKINYLTLGEVHHIIINIPKIT